jgi:hypothetical protein
MIMKNTITFKIRECIPEKDAEGNTFTVKEYVVSIEEQFKNTSKINASASSLIMKILTSKYNENQMNLKSNLSKF